MTGAKTRIGEAISTKTISSKAASKEEAVGNEEPMGREGGTGSG
jgi:hypothetical protein